MLLTAVAIKQPALYSLSIHNILITLESASWCCAVDAKQKVCGEAFVIAYLGNKCLIRTPLSICTHLHLPLYHTQPKGVCAVSLLIADTRRSGFAAAHQGFACTWSEHIFYYLIKDVRSRYIQTQFTTRMNSNQYQPKRNTTKKEQINLLVTSSRVDFVWCYYSIFINGMPSSSL